MKILPQKTSLQGEYNPTKFIENKNWRKEDTSP